MATEETETLARLETGQADLKSGQAEIAVALKAQSAVLRLLAEQLGVILEKLTPQVGEGPTIEELLAEPGERVGENGAFLRRIDRRTDSMAISLADNGAVMKEAGGANGNGANGRDVSGDTGA